MKRRAIVAVLLLLAGGFAAHAQFPASQAECYGAYASAADAALQVPKAELNPAKIDDALTDAAELVNLQYSAVAARLCTPWRMQQVEALVRQIRIQQKAIQTRQVEQKVEKVEAELDKLFPY